AIAPVFLDHALQTGGFARAMNGLAACLIVTGALSAAGMYRAKARLSLAQADCMAEDLDQVTRRKLWLLWLTYFGGVMAGLMVIGHAAGIAAEANAMSALWLAPAVLAICNLIGSLSGGRVADKHPPRLILILLSSVSVLALVALGFGPGLNGTLVCLGLVGFAYGGTIAAHPAYIAKRFGHRQSAAIYGRIFTAWGAAGLAGPWLAGFLFEASGTYMAAILIAACFGGVAILSALTFFGRFETRMAGLQCAVDNVLQKYSTIASKRAIPTQANDSNRGGNGPLTREDTQYDRNDEHWHELLLMGVDPVGSDHDGLFWVIDRLARIFGRTA
ncbi:MAG: MFS transporter, partial [Pseudomonadota bacterium]